MFANHVKRAAQRAGRQQQQIVRRLAEDAKPATTSKKADKSLVPPPPPAGKKPEAKSSGNSTILFLLMAGGGATAYYFQDEVSKALGIGGDEKKKSGGDSSSAADIKKDLAAAEAAINKAAIAEYADVRKAIVSLLDDEKHDDGSWAPLFIRLAWHSAGTYDKSKKLGGSEGATMRWAPESDWGANAGLHLARARLEPVKAKYPSISYSDLWTLAGAVAIEEMGGPKIPWRSGRKDAAGPGKLPDGLLPDADGRNHKANPADHLRDIFGRMGFTDQEIVALSGAHAVGRCHTDRSGFWGPWTRAPTAFSNDYYQRLLEEKWALKKDHEGKPWKGPAQFETTDKQLMMLPTDMALINDKKMRPFVEKYANDEKLFFEDFAKAFTKLIENGVGKFQ